MGVQIDGVIEPFERKFRHNFKRIRSNPRSRHPQRGPICLMERIIAMGLGMDLMGLRPTGWKIKSTKRFLMKVAPAIAIGGGRIEAGFETDDGKSVLVTGPVSGLGLGAGGAADFGGVGREYVRSVVKYASLFKLASVRTDLYRYAITNSESPSIEAFRKCDLVLTTVSANAAVFGGSLDYYAFYKKGEPNVPRWVWFGAGTDLTGGGSTSVMQYKSDWLSVSVPTATPSNDWRL